MCLSHSFSDALIGGGLRKAGLTVFALFGRFNIDGDLFENTSVGTHHFHTLEGYFNAALPQ